MYTFYFFQKIVPVVLPIKEMQKNHVHSGRLSLNPGYQSIANARQAEMQSNRNH